MSKTVNIEVPILARVEGEGALQLKIREGEIEQLALRIYEPPRFFEKFLEGRSVEDLPEMVARICGICPVAYQMSALIAVEKLFEVEVSGWVKSMRRLFYCGEWIQSHSLHIHLLAAPDFFGYNSAIEMAKEFPDEVRRGLHLQGIGNRVIELLGGRSVHPVGAKIGGFHRAPKQQQVDELYAEIKVGIGEAENLLRWLSTIELPNEEQIFTSVALREQQHYSIFGDKIVSDQGLDISIDEYESHFSEFQVPHSTALHSHLEGAPYLVGPLARMNLNFDQLPARLHDLCDELGIHFPSKNMFHSLLARGVELVVALYDAEAILANYQVPEQSSVPYTPKAGVAYGATCAPRGLLWHRYEISAEGEIVSANIVPPTSQNQARIEEDLHNSLTHFGLTQTEDEIRLHGEQVIRNYDPCISCATHFLKLKVDR